MGELNNEKCLRILTVNCQGLGDIKKRRNVFKLLKNKNDHIYFLQDTHFLEKDENFIQTQWGCKAFFNSFKSNSRGVAILFNNNFEFKINKICKDSSGNLLILDIIVQEINILLINIYGPNLDTPDFYSNLSLKLEELHDDQHIILGGDFNLIMNMELDSKNYKNLNNKKARQEVIQLIDQFNLKDIFRQNNSEKTEYTWRKKNL